MKAVIVSGGQQHHVAIGQIVKLDKLPHGIGDQVKFDRVLLLNNFSTSFIQVGTPFIESACVTAEVLEQGRHKKIHIIKMRRRKHYMRHQGHRQDYTAVRITGIKMPEDSNAVAPIPTE